MKSDCEERSVYSSAHLRSLAIDDVRPLNSPSSLAAARADRLRLSPAAHAPLLSFARSASVVAALSFQIPSKVVAAGAAAAFSLATPAFAGDAGLGEQVFSGNCAACHAGGQNVIMPEKTLRQEALQAYLDGGANEKAVTYQVTNGKNAMPAFGGRLSDEDIANVAAYVISSSSAGWD